jgi:hypothetical protein
MLVIEGSDGLGKTTFAKAIVRYVVEHDYYPVMYSHMTRQNGSFNFFEQYKPFCNPFTVQDRFHLGGIAYHTKKITLNRLRIIEGWIHGQGGQVIILYCPDFHQYEKYIEQDLRGNLLDTDLLIEANRRYYCMAEERSHPQPIFDEAIAVKPEEQIYPNEDTVERVAEEWIQRRREVLS